VTTGSDCTPPTYGRSDSEAEGHSWSRVREAGEHHVAVRTVAVVVRRAVAGAGEGKVGDDMDVIRFDPSEGTRGKWSRLNELDARLQRCRIVMSLYDSR
jgi:hypothetical protein